MSRTGYQALLVLAHLLVSGCALHTSPPVICNTKAGVPYEHAELAATPIGRWTEACAEAIAEVYLPPRHAKGVTGVVVVVTEFDRKGKPVSSKITTSSGSGAIDAHAQKAVLRARCPRVPASITDPTLSVGTVFHYGDHDSHPCATSSRGSNTP